MEFWVVYSMLLAGVSSTFKVFWVVSDCPEIHVTHRLRGRKGEEEEELGRMMGVGTGKADRNAAAHFFWSHSGPRAETITYNDRYCITIKKPGKTGPQERKINTCTHAANSLNLQKIHGLDLQKQLGYTITTSSTCYTHTEQNSFLKCTKKLLWTYITRATISMQLWDA